MFTINQLLTLLRRVSRDDCAGLAAEMAFHLMLALLPASIFLVSLFGLLGNEPELTRQLVRLIYTAAPAEVASFLHERLQDVLAVSSKGLVITSFLFTLWTASNGVGVVFKGMNRIYQFDTKAPGFVWRRVWGMIILILFGLLLFIESNLVVMGKAMYDFADQLVEIPETVNRWLPWIRWSVLPLGLFCLSIYLYALLPALHRVRFQIHTVLPGALLFMLVWLFSTWGFEVYLTQIATFNQVYGTLGAVVLLMIWLYVLSIGFLFGVEVNALRHQQQKGADSSEQTSSDKL
ncbi:MAG: YihY/virulence factor BrkB family protein [Vampirovibrio sp.]|nr:YihY/virulence factor BrkB family protein [Vampirovibrio sp.]